MQLVERYRPSTWSEVVGQDATVQRVKQLAARGLAGRAYWVSGPSGCGKTSIARLLAADVAGEWDIQEYDGTTLTEATAKELAQSLALRGLDGKGRAIIINEAHGLRRNVIRYLLVALERIPQHAVWVFTTIRDDDKFEDYEDGPALLSRCVLLPLAKDTREAFAARAKEIAVAEGIDGQPLADYRLLAERCKGNLRAMIQAIEVGDVPRAPVKAAPPSLHLPGETLLESNRRRSREAAAGR